MRLLVSSGLFLIAVLNAAPKEIETDAWHAVLSSVNVEQQVLVLSPGASPSAHHLKMAEAGRFIVVQGESRAAEALGFRSSKRRVIIRAIVDAHAPQLPIIWKETADIAVVDVIKDATVFAKDRWSDAPVLAGVKRGKGGVLWLATGPGERGYERYPYLLHALADLGLRPPLTSNRLWAFFDTSYRMRVDLDYFAAKWRKAGIAALHVAAWHYQEPDADRDRYLMKLIDACHRNAITVYAWLELPHVSERFWQDHPEWREKTALLQDAHLDWRKLMNLQNPDCRREVARGMRALMDRFDWDGVNLGELYFESLEGFDNKARFTPMNEDVRRSYRERHGVDPANIKSEDTAELRRFLDFRAELTRQMQSEWIGEVEAIRKIRPGLDLVLTHIDDRYDRRMRDLLGADAEAVLPMLEKHDFTFLIEDPATTWHLGPERYPQIAAKYRPLTARTERLAIDINIVERYQDVYPTKQQTGTELFQLIHLAAGAFARVALYFENSILKQDWGLLPAAAASAKVLEITDGGITVDSSNGLGVRWAGPASVDGAAWPVTDDNVVWLPGGRHRITAGAPLTSPRILDLNADLLNAKARGNETEFEYRSATRAILSLDSEPSRVQVDNTILPKASKFMVLPPGRHRVRLFF